MPDTRITLGDLAAAWTVAQRCAVLLYTLHIHGRERPGRDLQRPPEYWLRQAVNIVKGYDDVLDQRGAIAKVRDLLSDGTPVEFGGKHGISYHDALLQVLWRLRGQIDIALAHA